MSLSGPGTFVSFLSLWTPLSGLSLRNGAYEDEERSVRPPTQN